MTTASDAFNTATSTGLGNIDTAIATITSNAAALRAAGQAARGAIRTASPDARPAHPVEGMPPAVVAQAIEDAATKALAAFYPPPFGPKTLTGSPTPWNRAAALAQVEARIAENT